MKKRVNMIPIIIILIVVILIEAILLIVFHKDEQVTLGEEIVTEQDETEVVEENSTKHQLMQELTIYAIGDSIMEGYRNNYVGIPETMAIMYGANIGKNYACCGACLTYVDEEQICCVPLQWNSLYSVRLKEKEDYTDQTVILVNGGLNDLLIVNEDEGLKKPRVTLEEYDDPQTDLGQAFAVLIGSIVSYRDTYGSSAPIVYIQPYSKNIGQSERWNSFTKEICNVHDGVIYIDCNELLEESDIHEDGIHILESGYKKIADKVVDELYNYYNQ